MTIYLSKLVVRNLKLLEGILIVLHALWVYPGGFLQQDYLLQVWKGLSSGFIAEEFDDIVVVLGADCMRDEQNLGFYTYNSQYTEP